MTTRAEFIEAVRSYLGVRWSHVGRSRQGVDCVGLLVVALQDVDLPVEDLRTYTREPQPSLFLGHIRKQSVPADQRFLKPGMIALFRQAMFPMHIGIVARDQFGRATVIHAAAKNRRVVEEPFNAISHEIIEVRDIPGLED